MRLDTSLLRADCWTMASGMRLASRVNFQCGEIRKFDWCCEILLEAGAPCGSHLSAERSLEVSSVSEQSSVFSSVITNCCPWCRSTFSTTDSTETRCPFNVVWSLDAGAFPWPISPPKSLSSAACVMMKLFTHPSMNYMIILLQSSCPGHLL